MNAHDQHRAKILAYLSQVGVATRNDIMNATKIAGKTLTKILNSLQEEGVIELISERPKTYRYTPQNLVTVDFKEIPSYYDLKFHVLKQLKELGWRLSPQHHEVAAVALIYSRYTRFRTLLLGSQGIGKTSLILAVFGNANPPIVIQDLHAKNLYDVISSVKSNTKVIEEQYRHAWGREIPSKFDKFPVVPLSKIGPSELIFRFVPVRVIQPSSSISGFFKQAHFEFLNVPKPRTVPLEAMEMLDQELSKYWYFTIDPDRLREAMELMKLDKVINYTDDKNAEFYRINARYDLKTRNDVKLANWKELWDNTHLYDPLNRDLQLWNNALEVLKFNYAWLEDVNGAVEQTVEFLIDAFKTFTLVKEMIQN